MNRRGFVTAVATILATPFAAEAQPVARAARVGVLLNARWPPVEAFPPALREHGWIEGQNLTIDWRSAEGRFERHPGLAADLVRLKPDVVVTGSNRAVIATRQATATIPIVFVGASDPVGAGFVASLANPAGNTTGLSLDVTPQEAARDIALLRDAVPSVSRVAVIRNPTTPGAMPYWREMQAAAPVLRVTLQSVEVEKADDFDNAFTAIIHGRAQALYVRVDALMYTHRTRLVDFARTRRLPMLATLRDFADAGSLMSQAVHWGDLWRRAATYVDKILKGAKPGNLPVEQPTKFEFVVNLKTAKALGVTVPQSLLLRADHVIE